MLSLDTNWDITSGLAAVDQRRFPRLEVVRRLRERCRIFLL